MIDPFHLEAYGKTTVIYNRDIEIFPVLNTIFEQIYGTSPYKSPTDMGVNMAGNCIVDDEVVREASKQEVIRRYYKALVSAKNGENVADQILSLDLLMKQLEITPTYRKCVQKALDVAEATGEPAAAMELDDGRIITGKTSDLLGASSALILNALKALAGINADIDLVSPVVIGPIQDLKVNHLGNKNPRLHTDEVLLALSISAATNPTAEKAMQALENLRGCEMHSTVILADVDMHTFSKLGVHVTCEPTRQRKAFYHK